MEGSGGEGCFDMEGEVVRAVSIRFRRLMEVVGCMISHSKHILYNIS